MLLVENKESTDPFINLAIEEYLLRHVQVAETLLLLYTNEPSVIIGRNQNVFEEIDPDYVKANGLHLVRRLSGGGAVYHDLGNLNFSFISQGKEELHQFAKITGPVIRALNELGVAAEFRGKSHIFAAGKKISGNAQYATGGRLLSHGTLLFDSDLDALRRALSPRQVEIESRAVQSLPSPVINILELLSRPMNMGEFKRAISRGITGRNEGPTYPLTPDDWRLIHQISAERFRGWEWNYGRSPKFTVQKREHFPSGELNARIEVKGGRIHSVRIKSDLVSEQESERLAERLIGVRYEQESLEEKVSELMGSGAYIAGLENDELLSLLY